MRTEILATIDELNQYLNGNVTDEGLKEQLEILLKKLIAIDYNLKFQTNYKLNTTRIG